MASGAARGGSGQSRCARVHVHWGGGFWALTVVCDAVLQARQLVNSALGGARDELLAQGIAVQGLRFSIPIRSHVVAST